MPDETTPWVIKGVSQDTRRKVKVYAAQHDMTMAQAIEMLVDMGLDFLAAPEPERKEVDISTLKRPRVSVEADEAVLSALTARMQRGHTANPAYEEYLRGCLLNNVEAPMTYDEFMQKGKQ